MTILEKLEDERIVWFSLEKDNTVINATECCDFYYEVNLSKAEVKQLINELTELYEQMKEK